MAVLIRPPLDDDPRLEVNGLLHVGDIKIDHPIAKFILPAGRFIAR